MIQHIHRDLLRWGRWVHRQKYGGIGYSDKSPIWRLMQYGLRLGAIIYESIPMRASEYLSEVDNKVRLLEKGDIFFLFIFYDPEKTIEEKAKALHFSKRKMYYVVHNIHVKIEKERR